jgi:hypothetical protein
LKVGKERGRVGEKAESVKQKAKSHFIKMLSALVFLLLA